LYGIGEGGRDLAMAQKQGSARVCEIVDLDAEFRGGKIGMGMRAVCGL